MKQMKKLKIKWINALQERFPIKIDNKVFAYFLFILTFISCNSKPKTNEIVGKWNLVTWQATDSSASVFYPYGENAKGVLYYSSDSFVSLTLVKDNRISLKDMDRKEANDSISKVLYNSIFTYEGTYSLDLNTKIVSHFVDICNNPDWDKTTRERFFQINKDTLILLSTEQKFPKHKLIWVRERER